MNESTKSNDWLVKIEAQQQNLAVNNRAQIEPNKSGHSQTVDCLRQNIKTKTDEVNVLKGKVTALTNMITSQSSLIKLYESV